MTARTLQLLDWYRASRRDLPWRRTQDPYAIWVSELMLQQTRVETVIPYYQRFLERFPDVASLAAAEEDDVVAAWSGLGYYRRARSLHRAARRVVLDLDGRLPDDVEGWLALPGVGRYTAGAVVSIAFGRKAPILDGNVARVLSRWFAIRGDIRSGAVQRRLWALAEEVLPDESVGDFNQALMELGALVCTPTSPRCLLCPVAESCEARSEGLADTLPESRPRPPTVKVRMASAVIERDGRYLLYRRESGSVMGGLWEFPTTECRDGETPAAALSRDAGERYGLSLDGKEELGAFEHSVMNRRISLHVFRAGLQGEPGGATSYRWLGADEIEDVPVSSIVHKTLEVVADGR